MDRIVNAWSLTGVAGAVAAAMGEEPPRSAGEPLDVVVQYAKRAFSGQPAERVLLYNPDAVALWLYQKYTPLFEEVLLIRTQLKG